MKSLCFNIFAFFFLFALLPRNALTEHVLSKTNLKVDTQVTWPSTFRCQKTLTPHWIAKQCAFVPACPRARVDLGS